MDSRGTRTQRRAAERAARDGAAMEVPAHIIALADSPHAGRVRPPCPIDPACRIDHLTRKGRRRG